MKNVLESADTRYMLEALKQLNIPVEEDKDTLTVKITGNGGPINREGTTNLFLGNAGTAMRPMTGALCHISPCYFTEID